MDVLRIKLDYKCGSSLKYLPLLSTSPQLYSITMASDLYSHLRITVSESWLSLPPSTQHGKSLDYILLANFSFSAMISGKTSVTKLLGEKGIQKNVGK